MGKATVLEILGDGKYSVALDHAQDVYVARRGSLETKLFNLQAQLSEATADYSEAYLQRGYALDRLDVAINSLAEGTGSEDNVKQKTSELTAANTQVLQLEQLIQQIKLTKLSTQKRIDMLDSLYLDEPRTVEAWCADYSIDLSGDVSTIDVGLVGDGPDVIIRPAGNEGSLAEFNAEADPVLMPTELMSANAAFLSYALLPGVAKWKPRYRTGIITETDGETCTVELDAAPSTHQSLDINQETSVLAGFSYMNCNGAVFNVGDHVVVAFTDREWGNPLVIGFKTNPRVCNTDKLAFLIHSTLLPRPTFIGNFETLSTNQLYQTFNDIDEDGDGRYGFVPSDYYPQNVHYWGGLSYLCRPNQMIYDEYIYDTDNGQVAVGLKSDSDLWVLQNGLEHIASFGKTTRISDTGTRSYPCVAANDSNVFCVAREDETVKYVYWMAGGFYPDYYSRWAEVPEEDRINAVQQFGSEILELNRYHILDKNGALQSSGILDSRTSYVGQFPTTEEFTIETPKNMAANNNYICLITQDDNVYTFLKYRYVRIYDTFFNHVTTLVNGRLISSDAEGGGVGPTVGFGSDYMVLFDPEVTTASFKLYSAETSLILRDTVPINYISPVVPDGGSLPVTNTQYWLGCDGPTVVLYVVRGFTGTVTLEVQVYQWTVRGIDQVDLLDLGMVKRYEVERVVGAISFRYPYVGEHA